LVTTTSTVPAACVGVVAVIVLLLVTVTFVAVVPPNFTVAPDRNLVPVIVTGVPPLAVPELGPMPVTVGAGLEAELTSWIDFATEGTPLLLIKNNM